ncbi:hypothetical protein P5V15_002846 [Pogonomyrmex californicus]
MSDEEIFDDVNNKIEDEDDKLNTLMKQELTALVKNFFVHLINLALYAKNWKKYAGKNFCKDLVWESIGSSLLRRIAYYAAKEWYNIRQRFSRERRKVMSSLKRKSGQGSKPYYVSKWQFYNHCLFLVDHIMPRKYIIVLSALGRDTSSYMSQKNMKKISTIEKTSLSPIFILPSSPLASFSQISSSQALSSQAPFPQASVFLSPSSTYSSNLKSSSK